MPATGFGAANFTDAFKKVIAPRIQDNLPNMVKLMKVMKKNEGTQFFNNQFYAPVRTGRQSGVANLATDKSKLLTGSATTGLSNIGVKYATGVFDITDAVVAMSSNQKGAVESALEFQTKTLMSDFSKNLNRQFAGDGYGILAEVAGSVSGTAFTVQYPTASVGDTRSVNWYGTINGDIKPTKYLYPGAVVAIGSAATAIGTVVNATYTTGATGTITLTGATASAANDPIYLVDGDLAGAGTSEIQGLAAALSTGTADYAGIARSVDIWQPQQSGTASTGALTLADMDSLYAAAYEYANEGDRYAWFVNKSLYNKYGELLTALRRTVNKTELVSGWSGLSFEAGMGNVGVFMDYEIRDGEAKLINLDSWTICEVKPMGFVDDGRMFRRSDYLMYQNVWAWYANMLCTAPSANGTLFRRTR